MRATKKNGKPHITIDPGEFYVTRKDEVISTLLGSCVAACLYDPLHNVIGMNHFLLANRRYAKGLPVLESEAGRYGIHAMEILINEMLKLGALKHLLRAKAFGGGDVLHGHRGKHDNFYAVGEVNSRFVKEFLRQENIPLLAADLGGDCGRVIHFTGDDYSVYLRKIDHRADPAVAQIEHTFWEKSIKQHEEEAPAVQFW